MEETVVVAVFAVDVDVIIAAVVVTGELVDVITVVEACGELVEVVIVRGEFVLVTVVVVPSTHFRLMVPVPIGMVPVNKLQST